MIDGFHLPGLQPEDVAAWDMRAVAEKTSIRFPRLVPGALTRIAAGLVEARSHSLAHYETARIVQVIDRAAARLADRSDPLRRLAEDALPALTGYSTAMVSLALERITADWRRPALEGLLQSELGDAAALDNFVPRPGTSARSRAFGPRLAFHLFAGNVPGVAVTSLVRSLLVKAATLGKTASGEPLLAVLFARAIAEIDPSIGRCVAITYWPGGDAVENEAFAGADLVVAYGGREALAHARAHTGEGKTLVEHGPRVSLALVGRDVLTDAALADDAARHAARAVAIFDQQGCVSPHVVYVEGGGVAAHRDFARRMADHLATLEVLLPRASVTSSEAAEILNMRSTAEFREIAGEGVSVFAGAGTSWTVISDPDPRFEASCLQRLVRVKAVEGLGDAVSLIAPYRDVLQTVGVVGAGQRLERLAAELGATGATRVTSLEAMPWPPPGWHHDGRGPLLELLHWVDLES